MNITTAFIDFDGVLFETSGYFSEHHEKTAGLPAGTLQPFFKNEFQD